MGRESSGPTDTLQMEPQVEVDTGKMTEEVMDSLDKFRYKGKEEEEEEKESDSDESFEKETDTKADPISAQQRELSPEPKKPASPETFGRQESPEPPKTQQYSMEPEVVQEQPKHQDQFAAFESRDPSADILGDNFQQDQKQQQPSEPQGKFLSIIAKYLII